MNVLASTRLLLALLGIALLPGTSFATPTNTPYDCRTDSTNTVCDVTVSVVSGSTPCTFTVTPDTLNVYGQGGGGGVTIRWTLDAATLAAGWRFDPFPPVSGLPFPHFNVPYVNFLTDAAEVTDYNTVKRPAFPYRIKLMYGTIWYPGIPTCIKDPTIANQG